MRWLAPLTAMAAVVAGMSLVGLTPAIQHPPAPEPVGTMPPYYVKLAMGGDGTTGAAYTTTALGQEPEGKATNGRTV